MTMPHRGKPTTDAIEILDRRHYSGRPKRQAELEQARLHAAIAQEIYNLRTKAGLTQRQLAARIGTSVSAISRLEDADYNGHSMNMLVRITAALNRRVLMRTVPISRRARKVPV
jgi:ribosome-binding protein aMBF1 (putative translation factor)